MTWSYHIPSNAVLYVFPPEILIPWVLAKIRSECQDVCVLLVMPYFLKTRPLVFESLIIGYPLIWAGG